MNSENETEIPQFSPWLSVWLKPSDTIQRIIFSNPHPHVFLLAVLGTMAEFTSKLIDMGTGTALIELRAFIVIALSGLVLGIPGLYFSGFFLRLGGIILGGRAPSAQLRAVLAWGRAPAVLGLVICVIILVALKLTRSSFGYAPGLTSFLQAVMLIFTLWSVAVTTLMLSRVQKFGLWRAITNFSISSILILLVLLGIVRTFLLQPFNIPAGSMKPTLLVGDYFFVSKFSYGYSRFSLPFSLKLFSGRIFASEPLRGDVVVFRLPKDNSVDYVKRIVGIPGDRIRMIDGRLYINGEAVKRERIEDFIENDTSQKTRIRQWRETLPNGVSYNTLDLVDNGYADNTPEYVVPPGHYFMMGDNRDNSTDSRFLSQVGYIPFENLIGRVTRGFMSVDRPSSNAPTSIRWDRIGMSFR